MDVIEFEPAEADNNELKLKSNNADNVRCYQTKSEEELLMKEMKEKQEKKCSIYYINMKKKNLVSFKSKGCYNI